MLDQALRARIAPALDAAVRPLARAGVTPGSLTALGFVAGVGSCVAVAFELWWPALGLWLANRLLDGLDGPLARLAGPSERGGYLDIVADFTIYAGFVLALAIAVPDARLACAALLVAYYVSGTAFLAWSSLAEKRRAEGGDERSLRFVGGIAEGAETIAVYVLFCLLPGHTATIAWAFTIAVGVTALQRVVMAVRLLGSPPPAPPAPPAAR